MSLLRPLPARDGHIGKVRGGGMGPHFLEQRRSQGLENLALDRQSSYNMRPGRICGDGQR
jgi:hypothetical protein